MQTMSYQCINNLNVLTAAMHWPTSKDAVIGSRLLVPILHGWCIPRLIFLPADTVPELFRTCIGHLKHSHFGHHTCLHIITGHSCRCRPDSPL